MVPCRVWVSVVRTRGEEQAGFHASSETVARIEPPRGIRSAKLRQDGLRGRRGRLAKAGCGAQSLGPANDRLKIALLGQNQCQDDALKREWLWHSDFCHAKGWGRRLKGVGEVWANTRLVSAWR